MVHDPLTWQEIPDITTTVDTPLVEFDWEFWDRLLHERHVEIERPRLTPHPNHPSIIYPIDYGSLPGTIGGDGQPVDVWSGSGTCGLTALIVTQDHVKQDREVDLLWNCSPAQIYLVNGFVNFDRTLLEGRLILRKPMQQLWREEDSK